eukprot:gene43734-51842_t
MQETEAINVKQFDKVAIAQHLTEAEQGAPYAGWITKAFDGDARMMTLFDKTIMNMDICEMDTGEKHIVPKYDRETLPKEIKDVVYFTADRDQPR